MLFSRTAERRRPRTPVEPAAPVAQPWWIQHSAHRRQAQRAVRGPRQRERLDAGRTRCCAPVRRRRLTIEPAPTPDGRSRGGFVPRRGGAVLVRVPTPTAAPPHSAPADRRAPPWPALATADGLRERGRGERTSRAGGAEHSGGGRSVPGYGCRVAHRRRRREIALELSAGLRLRTPRKSGDHAPRRPAAARARRAAETFGPSSTLRTAAALPAALQQPRASRSLRRRRWAAELQQQHGVQHGTACSVSASTRPLSALTRSRLPLRAAFALAHPTAKEHAQSGRGAESKDRSNLDRCVHGTLVASTSFGSRPPTSQPHGRQCRTPQAVQRQAPDGPRLGTHATLSRCAQTHGTGLRRGYPLHPERACPPTRIPGTGVFTFAQRGPGSRVREKKGTRHPGSAEPSLCGKGPPADRQD
jgi:hypothetical protein